jgi:CubicO group peptidase (beta-lactamase class C family)
VEPATAERARTPEAEGPDLVILLTTGWGLGFMVSNPMVEHLLRPGAFGHSGAGGSFGYAHAEAGIAVGYAMNKMGASFVVDARQSGLTEAVYASLS